MSHFTEMSVNFLQKNEAQLVKALEECFGEGSVEIHNEGAALMGYGGDNRAKLPKNNPNYAPPCHLIIRRENVGGASNDVGYRRTEDGKYVAYISDYDRRGNFSKEKQLGVQNSYTAGVTERQLKMQGYQTTRTVKNGTIVVLGTVYKVGKA